jgi:hypothetical protein
MTDHPTNGAASLPVLPCTSIVYRAILRKAWIDQDTGQVQSAAFMRRSSDVDGLSVSIAAACSPAECMAQFRACFGVATLHVGRIRDLGLDVVPDSPDHAYITGLPLQDDDPLNAERLARLLAGQARLLQRA